MGGVSYDPNLLDALLLSQMADKRKQARQDPIFDGEIRNREPSWADWARNGVADTLSGFGMDPRNARDMSEKLLGRPFPRPEADGLSSMMDGMGLLGTVGLTAPLEAGQAYTDARQGNYADAAGGLLSAGLDAASMVPVVGAVASKLARPAGEIASDVASRIVKNGMVDYPDHPMTRQWFADNLSKARDSWGPIGKSVDVYPPDGYAGSIMRATPEGDAGYIVKPDGELASLVKTKGAGPRGFSATALQDGIDHGATWLNAFDTELTKMYGDNGFKPVSRIPFSEDYARQDWGNEAVDAFMQANKGFNGGRPDVVFMVRDPAFKGPVRNGQGGLLTDDWDAAVNALDAEMRRLGYK